MTIFPKCLKALARAQCHKGDCLNLGTTFRHQNKLKRMRCFVAYLECRHQRIYQLLMMAWLMRVTGTPLGKV